MSAKSKADLTTDNNNNVVNQTTPESITPITLGTGVIQNIIDSMYNTVDDDLNRTQTFADITARNAAVPDFIGQKGTQIDTKTDYIAIGLIAGDWRIPANTQTQSDTYGVASGIDTYALILVPALAAYAAGNSFKVLFTNANTGPATLDINGLTARNIYKNGNVALFGGDIQAGTVYTLTFDGTNFQIDNSGYAATSSYKKYVARVTQVGAGPPSALELENTIGLIVWTRSSAGVFVATLANVFTANKTIVFFSSGANSNDKNMTVVYTSISAITFTNADDILTSTSIEIRIYP